MGEDDPLKSLGPVQTSNVCSWVDSAASRIERQKFDTNIMIRRRRT